MSSLHYSSIQKYPPLEPPTYPDNNAFGTLGQDSYSQRDVDFTTHSTKVFSVIRLPMIPHSKIWLHSASSQKSYYLHLLLAIHSMPKLTGSGCHSLSPALYLESSFHISDPTHPLKLGSKTTPPQAHPGPLRLEVTAPSSAII